MKKHTLLLLTALTVFFCNTAYTQQSQSSLDVNCIQIDALNCCNGNSNFPKYIRENSILAIKILHVNPFKTTVGAIGTTSVIDFGNDSLFNLNLSSSLTEGAKVNPLKKYEFVTVKGNPKKIKSEKFNTCCAALDSIKMKKSSDSLIELCSKKISRALNQLTLLNMAGNQLKKLFDTTFISKTAFTNRMWGILECVGISNICYCKTKTDTCCNCAAYTRYNALYDSLHDGFDCIKSQFNLQVHKPTSVDKFILSGSATDKTKKVTLKLENAELSFDGVQQNKLQTFFDNVSSVINKANSDSVKNALLANAEYIDECISKLCTDTATEFYQQSYITGPIEGDSIKVLPFIRKFNGDTLRLRDFPAIPIKIFGGERVNVSSGISYSFLGLRNDEYSIVRTNTDSQFVIKKTVKGTDLANVYLSTFLHFYNKTWRKFQGAGTIGISVNPTLESLKVMAGYSIIFGQSKRAILSLGVIAGKVDRLKTKYEKDVILLYKNYPALQESDLTVQRLRVGMFVGLSFNLSKIR